MTAAFNRLAVTTLFLLLAVLPVQGAQAGPSTSERLDAIERKLDSRSLLDMMTRLEQLQQDLQTLRGELEVQSHLLKEMQSRQREQYLDIDRRLQRLENPSAAGAPEAAGETAMPPLATAPVLAPPAAQPVEQVPGSMEEIGEKSEYDTALAVLREGRYQEAAEAFRKFLADHPRSIYADNAGYWLGEAYYVTREFDRAQGAFQSVVDNYPQSAKVPGSRLKLAYIYYEKKDWPAARKALTELVSAYPDTTVAHQAEDRLQRMKKEGH